jgi:hypothetical protein
MGKTEELTQTDGQTDRQMTAGGRSERVSGVWHDDQTAGRPEGPPDGLQVSTVPLKKQAGAGLCVGLQLQQGLGIIMVTGTD